MSEYQYYDFRALDRPLTREEMSSLREISSRAAITPTSFINTYTYGNFRGDPDALMAEYFDAFVYVANWGTHEFMFRVPGNPVDIRDCELYCSDESLQVESAEEHLLIRFRTDATPGDEEGEGWMDCLAPLRADFLRGDMRALYLGWLLAVGTEEIDDGELEPPVPPGLRKLSPSLQSLADFLDIDESLLESAAAASEDLDVAAPPRDLLAQWVAGLPECEKDALLVQAAVGENARLGAELLRRFQSTLPKAHAGASRARRTAGELRESAEALTREKTRREEERRQREREIEAQRIAALRMKRLEDVAARGEHAWEQVDRLIKTTRPNDYDRGISLLVDLRDVAAGSGQSDMFKQRVRCIADCHVSKPSFLRKLRDAGL